MKLDELTIYMPTHNRKEVLERSLASLKQVKGIEQMSIFIMDDHSDDPIEKLFKTKGFDYHFYRHEKRLGPDENMKYIFWHFHHHQPSRYMLYLDSDFIYREDFLQQVKNYDFILSHGPISFYNSVFHRRKKAIKENLLAKKSLGAPSTLWGQELVGKALQAPDSEHFDWAWSEYLREQGHKLYCTCVSFCQHIGDDGHNTRGLFDWALDFRASNQEDQLENQRLEQLFYKRKKTFLGTLKYLYYRHCPWWLKKYYLKRTSR